MFCSPEADANSWRSFKHAAKNSSTRLQYWTFHCWLQTLPFTISVVLSFTFILQWTFMMASARFERIYVTQLQSVFFFKPLSQCYHSGVFLLWEAVSKLCVWYLFMVQFPPACSIFLFVKYQRETRRTVPVQVKLDVWSLSSTKDKKIEVKGPNLVQSFPVLA